MSDTSPAVKIEDISSVKKKLSFEIPWADVKNELDAVYRKVGKTAKIKGFRPGKIPRAILEGHYRQEAEEETVANLVNKYYWDAVRDKQIPSVTRPQIEQNGIESEKDFTFSATVEVEPAVDPKDYLGLELEKEEPVVTDEDLEARLLEIRQMFATMEDLQEERGVVAGDFVTIDFTGSVEGKTPKELSSENFLLEVGSKTFVPGFEEQLIGMGKGEAKDVTVTFPEGYNASHLAGKEVTFTVNLKAIRTKRIPDLDDNFVKNFERYDSISALRDDIRKSLMEEKERKIAADFERSIGDRLLANNQFDVPDSFVERQIYYMMSEMQRRLVSGGMDQKKAAEFVFKLHDQFREEAVKNVKTAILIRNIAPKEGLKVGDEEVDERIRAIASQKAQSFESVKESLTKDDLLGNIREDLLSRKTYEFIASKAKISLKRPEQAAKSEERI